MDNVILLGLLGGVGVLVANYLFEHLNLLPVLVHNVGLFLYKVGLRLLANNDWLLELLSLLGAISLL